MPDDATRLLRVLIESVHVLRINGCAAMVEIPAILLEFMIEWEAHNEDCEASEEYGDSEEFESQYAA